VTDPRAAWLSVPLGLAFGALGLCVGPWLLRCYGALAHSMLARGIRPADARLTPRKGVGAARPPAGRRSDTRIGLRSCRYNDNKSGR
jgi:hypothetical protein